VFFDDSFGKIKQKLLCSFFFCAAISFTLASIYLAMYLDKVLSQLIFVKICIHSGISFILFSAIQVADILITHHNRAALLTFIELMLMFLFTSLIPNNLRLTTIQSD
jgi:hypothetical protein